MPSLLHYATALLSALATTASAGCTYTATDKHCALVGHLNTPTVIRNFTSTSGDFTSCREKCLTISACVTFSFDSVTKQCGMYSQLLNNQGWRADSKSTTTFWQAACFVKTCSSDPLPPATTTTPGTGDSETTAPAGPAPTGDPDSTLTNPGDPNAVPADPSAFTATYTFFEGQLPVFTDPVPSAAGVDTAAPVPTCLTDPSNSNIKFEILNGKGIPLVYQGGNPPRLGLLTDDQAKPSYKYPQYHFEKPVGAPAGFYDLVLEDPSRGNFYLARDSAGNILLAKKSSLGQVAKKIDGQTVVTTIWTAACDGSMAAGTTDTTYVWSVSGQYTVAQPGSRTATGTKPFILFAKTQTQTVKKRNQYQDGPNARCTSSPRPLVADIAVKPKRNAVTNGCGSGSTAAWVPDLDFGHCCDQHDLCYDNCAGTKDSCDNDFLNCMNKSCEDDLGSFLAYITGCYKVSQFYHDVVAGVGGQAFKDATSDRCQCYCEDRTNNQLCPKPSGGLACTYINGNDPQNCGGCGQTCPSFAHCGGGQCHCNQDTCGGGLCLSLMDHPRNCGACGNVCASKYCYQGHCYDPPPPSPTTCPLVDAVNNGGFDTWNFDPWTISDSGGYNSFQVSGDEGHGPDAMLISATWPVVMSQPVTVCPSHQYTFTMVGYAYQDNCYVTVKLGGHQILRQKLAIRQHDADLPVAIGPGTISVNANDGAFVPWGVSRNTTLSVQWDCGGYATVYADNISLYVTG